MWAAAIQSAPCPKKPSLVQLLYGADSHFQAARQELDDAEQEDLQQSVAILSQLEALFVCTCDVTL